MFYYISGRQCVDSGFYCDGTCYHDAIACDFIADCSDGSDEEQCGGMYCSQQFITHCVNYINVSVWTASLTVLSVQPASLKG